MNYVFSIGVLVNTYSMTILLIVLGLVNKSEIAADIGIVQGATLALFFSFSANARSLILSTKTHFSSESIMASRLLLLFPLAGASYFLSVNMVGVESSFAIMMILRRSFEWLSEVYLSEMERLNNSENAFIYIIIQIILLIFVILWLANDFKFPAVVLLIWSASPLILNLNFLKKSFSVSFDSIIRITIRLLPHLGSTAIIGISVYFFRLLILLLLDKKISGDLFASFAIGGMSGGVFSFALGPSVVLQEKRTNKFSLPLFLRIGLLFSLVTGFYLLITAFFIESLLVWTGKSNLFWIATGCSLIGGVIMVFAQRIRLRLLQHDEEYDVFGPDVMMNILVIASIPYVFYLFGLKAMGSLYLLSSIFAYLFYYSLNNKIKYLNMSIVKTGVALFVIFPLYFQFRHGIYFENSLTSNSTKTLDLLPIPISVLGCYAGIILIGNYRRAFISFASIFFTFILLAISAALSTPVDSEEQQAKIVLSLQFILPMFALVLGQMFKQGIKSSGKGRDRYAEVFLVVISVVIPLQLLNSWLQGSEYMSSNLIFFGIYQHLEYVPDIFVSAYLIALFKFWQNPQYRFWLLFMFPVIITYALMSLSTVAIIILIIGLSAFVLRIFSEINLTIKAIFLISVISIFLLYSIFFSSNPHGYYLNLINGMTLPSDLVRSIDFWNFYSSKMSLNLLTFIGGHGAVLDRAIYPSAHNYYLDFFYNFGVLALLPLIYLLSITILLIYKNRNLILKENETFVLSMVVLLLLLVSNMFKVGLRQPYPGIFTYFIWGILLDRLLILKNGKIT